MTDFNTHRLNGLEPDNLLAFMALLGLLRVLEEVQPDWCTRVFWTVEEPPLRPALRVPKTVEETDIVEAASQGMEVLVARHDFGDLDDLKISSDKAGECLREAVRNADNDPYIADLWAAFVSDAVIDKNGKTSPTPLCLLGGGRQRFLKSLNAIRTSESYRKTAPRRKKVRITGIECMRETLFAPWLRLDNTLSFRWDPHEDVRHALRWRAPTDEKESTQHGANKLAAIGLSVLTVVPRRVNSGKTQLMVVCGISNRIDQAPCFGWPIWRKPMSLAAIRALLSHPISSDTDYYLRNPATRDALGIVELRKSRRISVGNYKNVTRADAVTAL